MTCPNSDAFPEVGRQGPGYSLELGRRISVVISLYDTKKAAAKAAGVTVEQLGRYEKGSNRPPFEVIANLAASRHVSLDWIWSGSGPMLLKDRDGSPLAGGSVDEVLLGNLVVGLERYLAAKDLLPLPEQKARMILVFYRILSRWRDQLTVTGADMPLHLRDAGHPVDIEAHPILSAVVGLID